MLINKFWIIKNIFLKFFKEENLGAYKKIDILLL